MSIDKQKIDRLRKAQDRRSQLAKNNKDLLFNLIKATSDLSVHLTSTSVEKTSNWLMNEQLWLENEKGVINKNTYRYSRGDVIHSVDWGATNIGSEIRYPHPAVVLYDGNDWVIVAPITAATKDKSGKPILHEFEVFAEANRRNHNRSSNEFYFKKDSVIQVDQIKRISKHRALNKKRLKIRESLLNAIDNIIIENFVPKKYELLESLKEKLTIAEKELSLVQEENKQLQEKIGMLTMAQETIVNK